MKKEFVTYEIAKKLRDIGFNEKCLGHYSNNGGLFTLHFGTCSSSTQTEFEILAPVWMQAIDFFREKYDIHVSIPNYYDGWTIDIRGFKQNINLGYHTKPGLCLENYYDAREEAILKAIELVQNKPK